jgi:polar amino acid transport system permease protein
VLHFGLPFGGPALITANANELITPFIAAFLALTLNQVAFSAEIIRGGLLSVDEGQNDAAEAIGMTRLQTLRHVVLPQAVPAIVPPLGNETISMLKNTSLVSVVALSDLLYAAQAIYTTTYQTIPLLIVASLWYLIMVSILSVAQFYVERHFQRGFRSHRDRPSPFGSLRRMIAGERG